MANPMRRCDRSEEGKSADKKSGESGEKSLSRAERALQSPKKKKSKESSSHAAGTKESFYPKCDVPMATSSHPEQFHSVASTYDWADVFVARVAMHIGPELFNTLMRRWRWNLSTCFTGVGCAEQAALALQAAVNKYAGASKQHVKLGYACEINASCQTVLRQTYGDHGQCLFPDIMKLGLGESPSAYCIAHGKDCTKEPVCQPFDSDCISLNVAGPVCVDYSMMGKRQQEKGSSWPLHQAFYRSMKNSHHDGLLIENVPEYREALVKGMLGPQWRLVSCRVDPRSLGFACARSRVFIIAFKHRKLEWRTPWTLCSFMSLLRSQVKMNAHDYCTGAPKSQLSESSAKVLKDYEDFSRFTVCDLNQTIGLVVTLWMDHCQL